VAKTLAKIRNSLLEADRQIIEEWKWMGSPVSARDRMIAVANTHKDSLKLTFSHGASLPNPEELFNGPRRQQVASQKTSSARLLITIRAN